MSDNNLLQIKSAHIIFEGNVYFIRGTKHVSDNISLVVKFKGYSELSCLLQYTRLKCHFQTSMSASAPGPKRQRSKLH